jgi:hypothetical protein
MSWINKTLNKVKDWWNQSSDALAGGKDDNTNDKKKFDPTDNVSTPGNTAKQRLAMSNRAYSN